MTEAEIYKAFGPMTFAKLPRCAAVNDKHAAQDRAITMVLGEPEKAGEALVAAGVPITGALNLMATQLEEWRRLALYLEAELVLTRQPPSQFSSQEKP